MDRRFSQLLIETLDILETTNGRADRAAPPIIYEERDLEDVAIGSLVDGAVDEPVDLDSVDAHATPP